MGIEELTVRPGPGTWKTGNSKIRSRIVNHSSVAFGQNLVEL